MGSRPLAGTELPEGPFWEVLLHGITAPPAGPRERQGGHGCHETNGGGKAARGPESRREFPSVSMPAGDLHVLGRGLCSQPSWDSQPP